MSEKKLTIIIQYIIGIVLTIAAAGIILVLAFKLGMWLAIQ